MGKGLEAGGAVFGFVDLSGAETVQQRAHDAPHMGVVVDDEEAQTVEIDADHKAWRARVEPSLAAEGKVLPVNVRLSIPLAEADIRQSQCPNCSRRMRSSRLWPGSNSMCMEVSWSMLISTERTERTSS